MNSTRTADTQGSNKFGAEQSQAGNNNINNRLNSKSPGRQDENKNQFGSNLDNIQDGNPSYGQDQGRTNNNKNSSNYLSPNNQRNNKFGSQQSQAGNNNNINNRPGQKPPGR